MEMLVCEVISTYSVLSVGIGHDELGPPWRCPPLSLARFIVKAKAVGSRSEETFRHCQVCVQWDETANV